jgi:hypothetical protein
VRTAEAIAAAVLLTCVTCLLILQGCAPVVIRTPSAPHMDVAGDSPDTVRTLGADHRFSDPSIQSVGQRAHELRAKEQLQPASELVTQDEITSPGSMPHFLFCSTHSTS